MLKAVAIPGYQVRWEHACALCGADNSFLDEMIVDDAGSRLFVCSDSDFCSERREAGHVGTQQAVHMPDTLAATPATATATAATKARGMA